MMKYISVAGCYKFIPEMYFRQFCFTCSAYESFTETKNKSKNLKRFVISGIFLEMDKTMCVFSMRWVLVISKI